MKLQTLCLMFLLQHYVEMSDMKEVTHRQKRAVTAVLTTGLSLLSEATAFGNAVHEMIKGESLGTEIQVIKQQLQDIVEKVEKSNKNQLTVINEIKWTLYQTHIADDKKHILHCYSTYLYFFRNPESEDKRKLFQSCAEISKYVTDIGRMLSGEPITNSYKPIFELQMDSKGHCDHRDINNTFSYLFDLFWKGCLTATVAESVKYGSAVNFTSNLCAKYLKASEKYDFILREKCSQESCIITSATIQRTINYAMTSSKAASLLTSVLPWFDYLIMRRKTGNKLTSSTSLKLRSTLVRFSSDSTNLIVVWTPKSQFRRNWKSNTFADVMHAIDESDILDRYVGPEFDVKKMILYDTDANFTENNALGLTANVTYLIITGQGDQIGATCNSIINTSHKLSHNFVNILLTTMPFMLLSYTINL